MKKKITTLFLLALGATAMAQSNPAPAGPGIGIGQPLPSQAAMLDIVASDKGVLIPRMELEDLTKFHLQGNAVTGAAEANEGILIYNNTANEGIPIGFYYWTNSVNGGQWELVTSQAVVEKVLERITTVEKSVGLTPGGGEGEGGVKPGVNPGEGGGTVIYRPGKDGKPGEPGKSGTIVIKDETGKDVEIDLADLLRESQTNTFFRVVDVKDPTDENKVVKEIYYFGEKAIANWVLQGNLEADAKEKMGVGERGVQKIEIAEFISYNFGDIINNPESKETIKEVIKNIEGNVTIGKDDKGNTAILVGDGNGGSKPFDLNQLETKTRFDKTKGDGTTAGSADVKTLPADATAKGKILYTYYGEDKDADGEQIPSYIDITSDFLTSIKENKEIREQIVNVISNPNGPNGPEITDPADPGYVDPIIPGGGGTVTDPTKPTDPTTPGGDDGKTGNENNTNWGNVYYGPVDPKDPKKGNVLYTLDKDGNKKYIDIAANIINEITNNSTLVDKIKEITTVRVEGAAADGEAAGAETGEVIDSKKVMKAQFNAVEVLKGNGSLPYNSEFNTTGFKVKEFGRLLSVQIIETGTGQLTMNTVTSVTFVGGDLKFKFGVGNMFATLAAGGKYDVIIEYVSTKEAN